jgi:hypothetical protein
MRMVLTIAAVFSLAIGACSKNDSAGPAATGTGSPTAAETEIGCIIRGEPTCKVGEAPKITVGLTNQSSREVYLVGSLDASDCKWRYPHCYFEVIGPTGAPSVRGIGRCGNMNTLRAKDFVKVPSGGTFDPYQNVDGYGFFSAHQLSAENFKQPGEYRVRFVYSTASTDIGAWGGDGGSSVHQTPK